MALNFFGRGSAFANDNTCAWFKAGDALVLIDFSQSAFPKFRGLDFSGIGRIYVLITHTHGDHVSGIGTMIHYAYYVLKKRVTVIAPCEAVRADMEFQLGKLEGCHPDAFHILTADAVKEPWFLEAIPTEHAPSHAGKCFGYALCVDGQYVLYTGDTHTLAPFIKWMDRQRGFESTFLFTEIAASQSDVHLYADEHMDELLDLCRKGVRVYLMHLDDEAVILNKIAGTKLRIVSVDP